MTPAAQRDSGGTAEDATRGRPRDMQRRAAVIAATRELLIANGYDEITLAGVARHAGVSRPFVYEHWGSKFALVEDAIFSAPGALAASISRACTNIVACRKKALQPQ